MKRKSLLVTMLVAVFLTVVCSCKSDFGQDTASITITLPGKPVRAADNIDLTFVVDCFAGTSTTPAYSITAGSGDVITFKDIEAGSYKINVKAYETGDTELLWEGSTNVVALAGKTVPVTIILSYVGPSKNELILRILLDTKNAVDVEVVADGKSKYISELKAVATTDEGVEVKNYTWVIDGYVYEEHKEKTSISVDEKNETPFNYSVGVVAEFSDGTFAYGSFDLYDSQEAMIAAEENETPDTDNAEVVAALYNAQAKADKPVVTYKRNEAIEKGKGKLNYTANVINTYFSGTISKNYGWISWIINQKECKVSVDIFPIGILNGKVEPVKSLTPEVTEIDMTYHNVEMKVPSVTISETLDAGWYLVRSRYDTVLELTAKGNYTQKDYKVQTMEEHGSWFNVVFIGEQNESSFTQMANNLNFGKDTEPLEVPAGAPMPVEEGYTFIDCTPNDIAEKLEQSVNENTGKVQICIRNADIVTLRNNVVPALNGGKLSGFSVILDFTLSPELGGIEGLTPNYQVRKMYLPSAIEYIEWKSFTYSENLELVSIAKDPENPKYYYGFNDSIDKFIKVDDDTDIAKLLTGRNEDQTLYNINIINNMASTGAELCNLLIRPKAFFDNNTVAIGLKGNIEVTEADQKKLEEELAKMKMEMGDSARITCVLIGYENAVISESFLEKISKEYPVDFIILDDTVETK